MNHLRFTSLLFLASVLFAGCSAASAPRLIGSYPSQPPQPPAARLVVYNSLLELQVFDVEQATRQAERLTYDYGGYLESSSAWYQGRELCQTLVLAVPQPNYTALRRALLRLGTLQSEQVSGNLASGSTGSWEAYAHITVNLRPWAPSWIWHETPGWNPLRTFGRAMQVAAAIFSFLIDASIWVLVITGPFILLGWGLRALLRRLRRAS